MLSHITINESDSDCYKKRTGLNARSADLTIALAVNYNTGGEKLTRLLAGKKFLALPLAKTDRELSIELYRYCRDNNVKSINVAGNSIATLNRYNKNNYTQAEINKRLFNIISPVHNHLKFEKMVSGGQTGVDFAGAVVAQVLGIPFEMNMPKDYRQRNIDGVDFTNTKEEVLASLAEQTMELINTNIQELEQKPKEEVVAKKKLKV